MPAAIETAFSNAAIVVFETDMARLEDPASQKELLKRGALPQDQILSEELPPSLYSRFRQQVRQLGLPPDIFDFVKPSVAAISLEALEMQRLGFSSENGVDHYLFKKAQQQHKKIETLESVDFQIRLVTRFSNREGEQLLDETLEDLAETGAFLKAMRRAWNCGDTTQLDTLLNRSRIEAPSLFRRSVRNRNKRWAPRIEQLLRSRQQAMVVVGAGHLLGKGGLLDLLRHKGWQPTQL